MIKILLSFCLCFNALAFEPIKKGQPSPVDGYVITKEQEKQLRQNNENNKNKIVSLEQLALNHADIIDNQQKQINTYRQYNNDLHEELQKKPNGFWEKTGYFVLGAVITGMISYGTIRATR